LLEKYKYPYLSIDHLKMGLIRSGNTQLTPTSDDGDLTEYLWKIVCEMIKTAVENKQNLIVEGCYIPFDWKNDFTAEYLENIKCICLVMTENYIRNRFDDIKKYENIIESRLYDDCTKEELITSNAYYTENFGADCVIIDETYNFELNI
jgi:hypothetical protein